MKRIQQNVIPRVESEYNNFTESEKKVADFFLKNRERRDFSAKSISHELYVSEATLSRFSKKAGFSGYREFIFFYEGSLKQGEMRFTDLTQNIIYTYNEVLERTNALVNETQIRKLAQALNNYKHVYVYGEGNSALSAQEFKMRFMRLGLHVEAISDQHLMKMNSILMDNSSLLIAMSVSGKNLRNYLKDAHHNGAFTVMMTANNSDSLKEICDEVILCPSVDNVDIGNVISPQLPLLLIIDILYAHFLDQDYKHRAKMLEDTLLFLERNK